MFKQPTNSEGNATRISFCSNYSRLHINLPLSPHPGPHFVAVNNKNEIIVTDFHNHSVKVKHTFQLVQGDNTVCIKWRFRQNVCFTDFLSQVYSADGEFLFKFGSHGEGNGQFNAPTGVAVDANGNIIVADWGNSRIQVRQDVFSLLST